MIKTYLFIAIFLFSLKANISCSRSKIYQNDDKAFIVSKLNSTEKISLYNVDIKDVDIFPIIITTDSASLILNKPTFIYIGMELTPLYICPGERIIVHSDSNQKYFFEVENNTQRTNELNFFLDFEKSDSRNTFSKSKVANNDWAARISDYLHVREKRSDISKEFFTAVLQYIKYKTIDDTFLMKMRKGASSGKNEPDNKFPQDDSCIYLLQYRTSALNNLNLLTKNIANSENRFFNMYDLATRLYKGETQKSVLFMLLNLNMDRLLDMSEYQKKLNTFISNFKGDILSDYLNEVYKQKSNAINNLSADFLDEPLITKSNTVTTLRNILSDNKGKIVVLDFWASYCIPCIAEFPYSKELEKEFSDQNISFIYLSNDTRYENWLSSINRFNIDDSSKSYLIILPEKSKIKMFYNIKSIPRYIVIDKKGKTVSVDAPRPSDPQIKNLLSSLLSESTSSINK